MNLTNKIKSKNWILAKLYAKYFNNIHDMLKKHKVLYEPYCHFTVYRIFDDQSHNRTIICLRCGLNDLDKSIISFQLEQCN